MLCLEDLLSVFCMEQSEILVKVSGPVVVFLPVVFLHVCQCVCVACIGNTDVLFLLFMGSSFLYLDTL